MARSMPDDLPPAGRKMRTSEAAELFGVSDRTIRRWARAGLLPAWRPDEASHWRILTAPPENKQKKEKETK